MKYEEGKILYAVLNNGGYGKYLLDGEVTCRYFDYMTAAPTKLELAQEASKQPWGLGDTWYVFKGILKDGYFISKQLVAHSKLNTRARSWSKILKGMKPHA